MFVGSKAKQYPYLASYLAATRPSMDVEAGPILLALFGGLMILIGVPALILTLLFHGALTIPLWMLGLAGVSIFGSTVAGKRNRKKANELEQRSRAVGDRLRATFDKKWFGRVRANPTLLLLDECARHWLSTREALDSMHWRRKELPAHYVTLREQASFAADRAMQEAMVLAAPHLPATAEKRDWADVIDDVLTEVLKGPKAAAADRLPAQFAPAREIAEKLRSLSSEVETLTRQVAEEPTSEPAFTAEHQLDLAIQEIRTVREAENELRQQTRG